MPASSPPVHSLVRIEPPDLFVGLGRSHLLRLLLSRSRVILSCGRNGCCVVVDNDVILPCYLIVMSSAISVRRGVEHARHDPAAIPP